MAFDVKARSLRAQLASQKPKVRDRGTHRRLPSSIECLTEFEPRRLESLELLCLSLKVELIATNHQEPMFCTLIGKYIPLWESGSIEAFKQAWLDCLKSEFSF
jgi:hypothetical protein